jgi:hypothetical protein
MDRATRFLAGWAVAGCAGFIMWLLRRSSPHEAEAGISAREERSSEGSSMDTLLNEVERQEDALAQSLETIQQRAILLVGAASIAATLSGSTTRNTWTVLSIIAAALAALAGLWAVLPMSSGAADLKFILDKIDEVTNSQLKRKLAKQKIDRLRTDMNRLISKAQFVGLGAILLAGSVVLLVVGVLLSEWAR